MAPPGMEEMQQQLQGMFQSLGGNRTRTKRMKVNDALRVLTEEEAGKLINEEELKSRALQNAEQNGIVFIDENRQDRAPPGNARCRCLARGRAARSVALVEGCTVATKHGSLKTDHVLFIASGAFHMSKPSDLIPELQGRFPIRVELDSLKVRISYESLPSRCLTDGAVSGAAVDRIGQRRIHRRGCAPHRRACSSGQ